MGGGGQAGGDLVSASDDTKSVENGFKPTKLRRVELPSERDLRARSTSHAHELLHTHGCCILPSGISVDLLDDWATKMREIDVSCLVERPPFDKTHFSYEGCDTLPIPEYKHLETCEALNSVLNGVLSPGWKFSRRGGDVVLAGSPSRQSLHSDWEQYQTNSMIYGFALYVSIAVHDICLDQAAIRVAPWSLEDYKTLPYPDAAGDSLAGFQLSLCKGDAFIRDVRMAHAGMPNGTTEDRVLPGTQVWSAEYLASLKKWDAFSASGAEGQP